MHYYRITKYDPRLRDETGRYMHEEWTDFSCVGIEINGKVCTLEEYEAIENMYIDAFLQFLACQKIDLIECIEVEKNLAEYDIQSIPSTWRALYVRMNNGTIISKAELPMLLKLLLRNYLWCKLIHDDELFVHFGWDYYMYIGVEKECRQAVANIEKAGLFVEKFKSPYLEDGDL